MNYVIVTRPEVDRQFQKNVGKLGLSLLHYPTIRIRKVSLSEKNKTTLKNLRQIDWIIFTSKNGVHFFMEALIDLGLSSDALKSKKLAAVGNQTSKQLARYRLKSTFTPT